MKIKNAIRNIMYRIFLSLSVLGFCLIGCLVDYTDIKSVISLILGWIVCMFIATLLYDKHIILRTIFCIYCIIVLVFGNITSTNSKMYYHLCKITIECDTFSEELRVFKSLYDRYYVKEIK